MTLTVNTVNNQPIDSLQDDFSPLSVHSSINCIVALHTNLIRYSQC